MYEDRGFARMRAFARVDGRLTERLREAVDEWQDGVMRDHRARRHLVDHPFCNLCGVGA